MNTFTKLMLIGIAALTSSCAKNSRFNYVPPTLPPARDEIVAIGAELELLWGEGSFTEGPAVAPDGTVYFTDIRKNRIMRFHPKTGKTEVFRENSGSANGLVFDAKGNLIACEGADGGLRRVTSTAPDGTVTVLSDNWHGKKLNSPNDVAVAPNGDVYFTDPRYRGPESRDLDFEGVFRVSEGATTVATTLVERPNGILIAPNGRRAYVADNHNSADGARHLLSFDIEASGRFSSKRVLVNFGTGRRGIDGMAMDTGGNIYATAGLREKAGVYVFSPTGKLRAVIKVPDAPTNCTFGGPGEENMLYITAATGVRTETTTPTFGLYRIRLNTRGL
jgi:sugar lactone lactonase YvrE